MQKRILVLFFVLILALTAFATDGNNTDSNSIACVAVYDPVCGSDGITYSNSCYAGLAGVSIAYDGECTVDSNATCTREGESYPVVPGYKCCEGLTGIQPTATLVGDECKMMVGSTLCSNCGNGTCEKWENKCNCPSDCSSTICANTGEAVYITEDFGPTYCCSKNDGVKPVVFYSEGACIAPTNGQKGTCVAIWWKTCGDGYCDSATEDKCNCEKDCDKTQKERAALGEKFDLSQGKNIIIFDSKEGTISSTSDLFTVQLDSVMELKTQVEACAPGAMCPIPVDSIAELTVTGICNAPEGAVCGVAAMRVKVAIRDKAEIFSDYEISFLNFSSNVATFVVKKKIPEICPSLYDPVCGGKEICVKCASILTSDSNTSSNDKCLNGGGCFVEQKTYANKCIMELEGAKFLYAGECGAAKTNYRNAYWQCTNGKEYKEGGESSCKPESLWRQYADESCKKACNEDSNSTNVSGYEKCGIKSFSVSNECSDNELTCGGIQGKMCPEGYYCVYKGNYPDADGKCVKKPLGDFYKGAYWKCSNGKEYKETSEKCLSSAEWKNIARKKCGAMSANCATSTTPTVVSVPPTESVAQDPIQSQAAPSSPITAFILAIVNPITQASVVNQTTTSGGAGGNSANTINSANSINAINANTQTETNCGGEVFVSEFQLFDECTPKACTHYIDMNGCQVKKCEGETEQSYCPGECRNQNIDEIKNIKEECAKNNGQVIASINEKGCSLYVCTKNIDANTCMKKASVPEEKYLSCKEKGGELIVKELGNGCVSFIDCIGSTSDTNTVKVPEPTDLLELALKLENLNIELGKLKVKLTAIQNYYIDTNNTTDANRIGNAITVLVSIETKIVELRAEIKEKINNFTEEDASALREGIREIKETKIKELVIALLG
ncbi:MAG: Kazal-type serine protease inhibitor family protein [archaeon]